MVWIAQPQGSECLELGRAEMLENAPFSAWVKGLHEFP